MFFTNDSQNAKRFEWDFGDGYISNAENPSHIFTGTGSFEVTLTAISKNGLEDKASLIIDVIIPTLLEIEVREWYDEYTVPDASVYFILQLPIGIMLRMRNLRDLQMQTGLWYSQILIPMFIMLMYGNRIMIIIHCEMKI